MITLPLVPPAVHSAADAPAVRPIGPAVPGIWTPEPYATDSDPHTAEMPLNGRVYDPTTDGYLDLTPADEDRAFDEGAELALAMDRYEAGLDF